MSRTSPAAVARQWQRKQRAAGLCVKCPRPRVNSQHCQPHADDHAALMRSRRQSADRCSDCARRLTSEEITDKLRRCQRCRIGAAEARYARNARILELARGNTMTAREIADAIGCGTTVVRHVTLAERRLLSDASEPVEDVPRCPRCHLTLPHATCLGRVDTFARRASWMVGA